MSMTQDCLRRASGIAALFVVATALVALGLQNRRMALELSTLQKELAAKREIAPFAASRRLAQKKSKPAGARRDVECVQIPANPNQPAPGVSHAVLDASSYAPFDFSAQRELYCKWYHSIGSGYHACKAFASPDTPCKAALRESNLLPSASTLAAALSSLSSISILIIGDSTMLNKFIFLRFLGLRSSCSGGPGVCFLPTYGLAGCCMHPLWLKQTKRSDFDVVWWSNAGLHYLHSGERSDRSPILAGVLGASMTSFLAELHNCSRSVTSPLLPQAPYPLAAHPHLHASRVSTHLDCISLASGICARASARQSTSTNSPTGCAAAPSPARGTITSTATFAAPNRPSTL